MKTQNLGIIGCGDYVQRWESSPISNSKNINVSVLYDIVPENAQKLSQKIGGKIVESDNAIFEDAEIDIVCLFIPPHIRKQFIEKAVKNQKHVITTKPIAPDMDGSNELIKIVEDNIRLGVFYGRTGDPVAETLKDIFESGEIGKLALYKQDWIHHYPTWNNWATDKDKNGGPFMDAMIHNLNLARYLMNRNISNVNFFSDNHAHSELNCNDTEFMKVDFEENGSAHLFITWAADLEIFDSAGNDREHIDICYMVSDQGWRITIETKNEKQYIAASKEGETKTWPVKNLEKTPYDAFAEAVAEEREFPRDIIALEDAYKDISILKNPNQF